MAHYAFLDENNIVTEVIVGRDEDDTASGVIDWEQWYGDFRGQVCKRTSYNTYGGQHKFGGTPYRKNYAGIGFIYDSQLDAFIPPKPYDSWVLDNDKCLWNAPIPYPIDGGPYRWSEDLHEWIEISA